MSTQNITGEIKKRTNWSIFMGAITALLGVFLIAYPLATATITTLLFGWVLIFVGAAQFVFAIHSHSVGKFFLKALVSALYLVTGLGMLFFPLLGVAVLTVLLGTLLIAVSAVEAAVAFQLRPTQGWGWYLFNAAAGLLMGILILAGWPSSSIWAIGTLVGVSVLMSGFSRVMIATRIRSTIGSIDRNLPRAA